MRTRFPGFTSVVVATVVACGGDDGTAPVGPPAGIESLTSANLVGTVGQQLATPLEVRVTDAQGRGVPNVAVTFTVTAGGGVAQPVTNSTDANGEARATWTLGTTAGAQGVRASVASVGGVDFSATAEPGPAAQLQASRGDEQAGLPNELLREPLEVTGSDQFGNPIPDLALTWSLDVGGGVLTNEAVQTDEQGRASATLTLGPAPALHRVTVSTTGLTATLFATAVTAVPDPVGDGFPADSSEPGVNAPDLTLLSAGIGNAALVVQERFTTVVTQLVVDTIKPTEILGWLDIDTDQDPSTGIQPLTDAARPAGSGSTGMGADHIVIFVEGRFVDETLTPAQSPNGTFSVWEAVPPDQVRFVGNFVPAFRDSVMTLTVPLALLGNDDGHVDVATLVGTFYEATDVAPNDGSLGQPLPSGVVGASWPRSTGRSDHTISRSDLARWLRRFQERR